MDIIRVLEPITADNLHELCVGEWVWDDKKISRFYQQKNGNIVESIGFRRIQVMYDNPVIKALPFILSDPDSGYNKTERFESGRFYRFKKRINNMKIIFD